MDVEQIERIRAFNRYYTQHLGVLTDRYLGQDRPLGPARLLYEIGDRADLRDLRERLGFDAGYLSRLLRALHEQGLIVIRSHPDDGRARIAELTEAGRRERAELDERSRRAITEALGGLDDAQRAELVAAQATVHRLLRTASTTIAAVDPAAAEARDCLRRYAAELAVRFPEGYDPDVLTEPRAVDGVMLLAREHGRPVGCGLWTRLSTRTAELRHLWIAVDARGAGLGRRLLAALEADAAGRGITTMRLGTHHALTEAIALYRRAGYTETENWGSSPYNQLTFEKPLVSGPKLDPADKRDREISS
ncbi:putative transcriptional regulator, MarR family protein [Actinoplanes ianthinogenes]|uniref:Transcriptional regulator, MarR family protein n=1 Tax=Actinoplanes ianthinogenes TaxID=122358 RepID=A0ABM7M907_9ACTN|nr:helix-turn-helix domain-containing GNAT family N-acetyltransferase [Actinoplanes ianthinogenes]BCJ48128.1 putative transcriptional regulator, MarR family protein [Actinoplanes ianthinogenes]GGR06626.1 putative transcriptional regulator, MarR family protein [Actinoplanes ianthinogenes]